MNRRRDLPQPNATLERAGEPLARVRVCRSFWERLRGVIGYAPLEPGMGVVLPRCAAIHTAFVAAPMDVLFTREGRVAAIAESVRPWRMARCARADLTIELGAGTARGLGIRPGDFLELRLD